MDTAKIEEGVRLILQGIGEDPDREGLQKTPHRVAKMYEEVFAGMTEDPSVHFETTFDEGHQEMVIVKDISFYSMCEHHWYLSSGRPTWPIAPGPRGVSAGCRSWRAW